MFDNSYDFMLNPHFKKLFGHGKPIVHHGKPIAHQRTCPTCGRTLVNLYKRDGVWKCKRCWDTDESGQVDEVVALSERGGEGDQ